MPIALGPATAPGLAGNPELDRGQATRNAANAWQTRDAAFARNLAREAGQSVEARRTPLSAREAGNAIASAFHELTGGTLDERGKAILTAQWAHETGHGSSMFNYNFGGIKGRGPSGLSVTQPTREGYGTNERRVVDQFRAYTSVEEGARDYVQLLISRYGAAVTAAQSGDASGFVRGLKDRGYFTGDPVAYERNILAIAGRLEPGSVSLEPKLGGVSSSAEGVPGHVAPSLAGLRDATAGANASEAIPRAVTPLAPFELLGLANPTAQSDSNLDTLSELSALRALEMSDQVTRAALRIAIDRERGAKRT